MTSSSTNPPPASSAAVCSPTSFTDTPSRAEAPLAYAMFDGPFQQALGRHLGGVESAPDDLRRGVRKLLGLVCC